MPSTTTAANFSIEEIQLICPSLQPVRGKPFQLSSCVGDLFVYPHGKSVFLYHLYDPKLNREFRDHAYSVKVAKLSPSGGLVASGDECGIVRIWSVEDLTRTIVEVKMLNGSINDLCWSEDEKYLAAAGEGRENFAQVIKLELGGGGNVSNFGEIIGPGKTCSSVALKGKLCVVGSDDKSLTVFQADPKFIFVKTLRDHDNFVQVTRFNGKGDRFASAGSDGKVFVYDSASFEVVCGGKWQDSGILAMEWMDNETLITGSADGKVKLRNISQRGELLKEINCELQISGISFVKESILILKSDGSVEERNGKTLELTSTLMLGHSKGIVDLHFNVHTEILSSVSYDGKMKKWEWGKEWILRESCDFPVGSVQKLFNDQVAISDRRKIFLTGEVSEEVNQEIIAFDEEIIVFKNGTVQNLTDSSSFSLNQKEINAAAVYGKLIAVNHGTSLHIYQGCNELFTVPDLGARVTCMKFGNQGRILITADDKRRIKVLKWTNGEWIRESGQWCSHSARIDTLSMNEEGSIIFSAGVDGHIMAWSLEHCRFDPLYTVKNAHSAPIGKLLFLEKFNLLLSAGNDSCIRAWKMK